MPRLVAGVLLFWSATACMSQSDDLDWYAEGRYFAENSLLDDGFEAARVVRECRAAGEDLTRSSADGAEFMRGCRDYLASA